MISKKDKYKYDRMHLKNGPDLQKGEKKPPSVRKQKTARAYELLVLKSDEDYIKGAENRKRETAPLKTADIRPVIEPSEDPKDKLLEEDLAVDRKENNMLETRERSDYTHKILDSLTEKEWQNKRRRKKILIICSIIALVLVFAGRFVFGPPILLADISSYENTPIQVEGIKKKAFDITPAQLSEMSKESVKVEVVQGELTDDEEPELGRAIGPTLETFLKKYGRTTDDFRSLRVYSDSGSSKAYVQTMKEKKLVLSIANGRTMLKEKEMPLRIAVDGERADEWFGNVRKLVLVK